MKKLFLLFAVVALASCVKENTLAPETQAKSDVTINAVSALSKATLDADLLGVSWKETDAIRVVLYDGTEYTTTDFAAESVDGANATFGGSFAEYDVDFSNLETAYAIYPASAFNTETGIVKVTLPENQVAGVQPEMLLASAYLDTFELEEGETSAEFNSALTLLQVVVPAGVQSVSLSASGDFGHLVGTCEFKVKGDGSLERTTFNSTLKTVKLANEDKSELAAKTYPVLVLPGEPKKLTLNMVDKKGDSYEKTIDVTDFVAGTARKIDLTKIFYLELPETLSVSPAGGVYTWAAVANGEFEVNTTADWITCEVVSTKAFDAATVVVNIAENTTEATRTAEVVVTWEGGSRTLTVTQAVLYKGFVYDEVNNPLEFKESFALYEKVTDAASQSGAVYTVKNNVFRIELNTEEPDKGTYVITNVFKAESFTASNGQPFINQGGVYYADYANGVLTVKKDASLKSYGFTEEVKLAYNEETKTFTQVDATVKAFSYSKRKDLYLAGYTAVENVVEDVPGGDVSVAEALYGTYTEGGSYQGAVTETLVIEASDDSSYDLKMKFFYTPGDGQYSYDTAYGKVSGDGKTITVTVPEVSYFYGPLESFTLSVNGNVISGSYGGMIDYSATKVVPFDVATLYGTYTEGGSYQGAVTETLVIEASDDSSYDLKMKFFYTPGDGQYSYDTAYGKVSGDGKTITVTVPEVSYFYGPLESFTLSVNGNVISGSYGGMIDYSASR